MSEEIHLRFGFVRVESIQSITNKIAVMDKQNVEKAIDRIATLQERLYYCENNLQYIKRLQALKYWLHKFDSFLDKHQKRLEFHFYFLFWICRRVLLLQLGNLFP